MKRAGASSPIETKGRAPAYACQVCRFSQVRLLHFLHLLILHAEWMLWDSISFKKCMKCTISCNGSICVCLLLFNRQLDMKQLAAHRLSLIRFESAIHDFCLSDSF
jgi:hypothetical protein